MDTGAPQHKAFRPVGIKRISYTVPDSFFPIRDASVPTKSANDASKSLTQWSKYFQGPSSRTQLRAWSRLQLPSQSSRNFSGTIMKRVGLPIPRPTKSSTIAPLASNTNIETPAISEDGMPVRRVLRRLDSYEASADEYETKGKPLSKLEMTGLQMQAKADVAHSLKTCPTGITRDEVRQRRAGHYVQTIPLKRRTETIIHSAGNRLTTYTEALDMPDSVPHFRVPSRRFSILPRQQAVSPMRSPVALFSPMQEPVTPAAVMAPPRRLSDAKSPTKRSPRHKSPPIKNDGPRISEPAVKLLPSTTPKIEPSPTKSTSPPPATPLSESRPWRNKTNATPSTFPKAALFGTAFADMQRHSATRPGTSPWRFSPTKFVIATPCPTSRAVEPCSLLLSPVKLGQLTAQTPSKAASVVEPATPRIFTNLPYLTADVPSPISFLSTLFSESPAKPQQLLDLETGTPQKPTTFDFGTTSPLFNSVTWLKNTETVAQRPVGGVLKTKSSRRQSEPLVRNFLKSQSRRQTISPQKLVFQAEQTFNGSAEGLFSPVKKMAQPKTPIDSKLLPATILPKPHRQSLGGRACPGGTRPLPNEVVNIDMRENPDIFSSQPMSLSLSPVMGAVLPSIAESYSEVEGTGDGATARLFSPSADTEKQDKTEISTVTLSASPAESSLGGLGIFDNQLEDAPVMSIEAPEETAKIEPVVIEQSPNTATRPSAPQKGQKLSPSPTLNLSFTPVNSRSPNGSESVQQAESIPESPPTVTTEIIETISAQSHDYDSPGRDYMREFIRRSRPKRPSTTEAGSPVGPTAKRKPLGPKSPNTESPNKSKRKHEKDHDHHESPLKKLTSASPKKNRRSGKTSTKKLSTANDNEEEEAQTLDASAVSNTAATADEDEDDAEMDSEASRRSSRLRNQTRLPTVKSAIPTPIKIGRNSGPTLNSAVRSEQQDLTNQTRMNTRRNRGNAEYPAQFLARQSEEAQTEPEPEQQSESSSESEGRKCVNWSNPLAMYQEDTQDKEKEKDKTKKAKNTTVAVAVAVAPSTKPRSVQMSGIAKPVTRAKTTADKERTARLAEHFGMVSNGTPAKPQRSTRSRMRI